MYSVMVFDQRLVTLRSLVPHNIKPISLVAVSCLLVLLSPPSMYQQYVLGGCCTACKQLMLTRGIGLML